ncbi:MAG: hypothetical protein K6C32_01650, partial [Bacilli bacterium]|nr:hypothetical protein [Bacilli bacterium]
MFKLLAILFTSLFVSPVLANTNGGILGDKINESNSVELTSRDNSSHEYTYTEEFVPADNGKSNTYYRTYDSRDLGPSIYKLFCAPSGYVLNLNIEQEVANEIAYQIQSVDGVDLTYYDISFYRCIYGLENPVSMHEGRYFEGDFEDIEAQKSWLQSDIKTAIDGKTILDVGTVSNEDEPCEVYSRISIQAMAMKEEDGKYNFYYYVFTFYGQSTIVEPYDEYDFIGYKISYDQHLGSESKIIIGCNLIPGFFKEYDPNPLYSNNPYGWTTSVTETQIEGQTYCFYNLSLIVNQAVPIASFSRSVSLDGGFETEVTYPDEPLKLKIKLEFISADFESHVYYSNSFIIGNPDVRLTVDTSQDRKCVQKDTEHLYSVKFDNLETEKIASLSLQVNGGIDRLMDDGEKVIYCYDQKPETGVKGVYYYSPSENEKTLHEAGKDDEFIANPSEGTYYIWDENSNQYEEISSIEFFNISNLGDGENPIGSDVLNTELNRKMSFPFTGRISHFDITMNATFVDEGKVVIEDRQVESFEILSYIATNDEIILDVDDVVNLLSSGDDIVINPRVSSYDENIKYYYGYTLSKTGIIDINQDSDGKMTIHPAKTGVVELTFEIDSANFSKITKTITIRVVDGIYDSASIDAGEDFHKAGVDLNVSLSVRGFTNIQNANITWKVIDKKGHELPQERIVVNKNASMTLLNPDSDDYTIKAFYDDIEVSSSIIEVRYVDMDNFLKYNIWWIVLITIIIAAAVILFAFVSKRGKSTVNRIERVYQVYCQCISNDSLSKEEVVRIRREITKCLHHCEDLNIDAFNQYEKATRYLRKSLADVKSL